MKKRRENRLVDPLATNLKSRFFGVGIGKPVPNPAGTNERIRKDKWRIKNENDAKSQENKRTEPQSGKHCFCIVYTTINNRANRQHVLLLLYVLLLMQQP